MLIDVEEGRKTPEVLLGIDETMVLQVVIRVGEKNAEDHPKPEYDHLSSDEAVEEGIVINEYTFTDARRRFE